MRVAVAGAGIGGLALALALHARGIAAVLCERAAVLEEAGAGVQLGPNAVRLLDRLGLAEPLRAAAFRPDAAEVRRARDGGLLLRTALGDDGEARWGAPYLQVHRADLQALLLEAVRTRGAAELRLGEAVLGTDPDGGLILGDGRQAADAGVGADGLRSAVADALHGHRAARWIGQAAWRAVVPRDAVDAVVPPAAVVWAGPGRHLVHYPIRGGRQVNLVAVLPERDAPAEGWATPGDPIELRARFAGWPAPVPQLLAAAGEVWRWPLYDRPPRARWSKGRATLLGDAAHPAPPFLAQGAAMAIEDAWVLAAELDARRDDVPEALRRYEAARRRRTAKVQAWSRRNATLFHLPDTLAAAAFGAAGLLWRDPATPLDWLYGWTPEAEVS